MDRRRRLLVLACVFVCSLLVVGTLFVTADGSRGATTPSAAEGGPYPGETLVTVQAYGWFGNHNGDAFILNESGQRVWEFQPENAAVFDAEVVDGGNVMVSYGQRIPNDECPEQYRDTPEGSDHCIENNVVELDRETKEVVWSYAWYDRFMSYHEVHDADRLASGETVIIDMGQHRVFTVDESGEVTWEWSAIEHLDEGSEFWADHVEGTAREDHAYTGPNQDWTHMNDVDRLRNGNFLLSIRNFDVLVEVDPETDDIVDVIGTPGDHDVMYEQHDPNYLAEHGTVIISDSENDRIVEYDAETMREVWRYEGPSSSDQLNWPRDADRLPNGNTLVTDSRGFRVLEINETGEVVWSHDLSDRRGIVYDADRLGPDGQLPEEPENVPAGDELNSTQYGQVSRTVSFLESWLGFVLPQWVGLWGVLAGTTGALSAVGLAVEAARYRRS
jgi:outer membrane protein assembly factor BamB